VPTRESIVIATASVMQTNLPLPNRRQGKVRDIYDATLSDGRSAVVMVATDRLSAFDVVMPTPVPGKGIVLTQISDFWFAMIQQKLAGKLSHHVLSTDPRDIPGLSDEQRKSIARRVTIGRRCAVVPIECVVRGYLAGSGWGEYQKSQSVCGVSLPAGLRQCDKLPEPIFTPATKAATGHDENVSFDIAASLVGLELMTKLRAMSLAIYEMARDYAATRGIIIADTKFEFGIPVGSTEPIVIDEVLTPDSSRFWPADAYSPGRDQPSFDKQFVRNHLQELVAAGRWDKAYPGPTLPDDVVHATMQKYLQAYRLLTGNDLTL
jgi:phosphoribosylaminoimidazole-succinocarboxamide synthase